MCCGGGGVIGIGIVIPMPCWVTGGGGTGLIVGGGGKPTAPPDERANEVDWGGGGGGVRRGAGCEVEGGGGACMGAVRPSSVDFFATDAAGGGVPAAGRGAAFWTTG